MVRATEPTGPDLCYCLASRRSARYLTRLYERHLAPAGLTSSQFSILSFLDHNRNMTVAELAAAMEMERTTLVRTLRPMKDAGWIEEGSEKIGRAAVLGISRLGRARLEEGRAHWRAAQEAFEKEVGKDVAVQVRDLVRNSVACSED